MIGQRASFFIGLLAFFSFALPGCGSGLNSYHADGLEQPGLADGVLTIPSSGVAGGRSYISDGKTGFYIDLQGSEPEAMEYLRRLGNREVSVSKMEISGSLLYSVRFAGTRDQGPCPSSSGFICSRIQLKILIAY